ncbi:hypothetical protein [Streptacidiphilus carbonis]|uniref:hypothetical protein n=1 Tax=Streptacidiphilus carbonis TaxID=105422 RepID=UPI0006948C70|nr:hypothetical protein [Streptacidiphilus carbonis]
MDSGNRRPPARTPARITLHAVSLPGSSTRLIDQESWVQSTPPLLRAPRELVNDLHRVHRPQPGTAVLGVLAQDGRVVAGASFSSRVGHGDGWQFRNTILAQLRGIVPHDLRLARPVRTAVLMLCRRGSPEWTEADGAWMWALRDASSLHGVRCGAYVTLTDAGWHVLGEGRGGRRPNSGSWAEEAVQPVRSLNTLAPHGAIAPLRVLEAAPEQARAAVR